MDGPGNVYVTDAANSRVRVFNPKGEFLRQWGSAGTGDGQFFGLSGIAVDESAGKVYVTDAHRVQAFTLLGQFLRKWGSEGTGDGQFKSPLGIAVDRSGKIYVTDAGNERAQVFTPEGQFLWEWGGEGTGDG